MEIEIAALLAITGVKPIFYLFRLVDGPGQVDSPDDGMGGTRYRRSGPCRSVSQARHGNRRRVSCRLIGGVSQSYRRFRVDVIATVGRRWRFWYADGGRCNRCVGPDAGAQAARGGGVRTRRRWNNRRIGPLVGTRTDYEQIGVAVLGPVQMKGDIGSKKEQAQDLVGIADIL